MFSESGEKDPYKAKYAEKDGDYKKPEGAKNRKEMSNERGSWNIYQNGKKQVHAANGMSLTRFIINMGYSASTGDDAVSRLREKDDPIRFPTDSSKNTQMGGGWYNTMDQYGDFLELKKDPNYLNELKEQ